MPDKNKHLSWGDYFGRENKSFFRNLIGLHRRLFVSRSVKYYSDKYFPKKGIFIEAGAGTSQSSSRIARSERKLIALDHNYYVLANHNIFKYKVQGDFRSLPIKSNVADGLWNLGVMEHMTDKEIIFALRECKRVMKNGGVLLIYWPPYFAPYEIVLNSIRYSLKRIFNKKIEFFPNEINLFRNKKKLIKTLDDTGLKLRKLNFNILDLFSYIVVVAEVKAG